MPANHTPSLLELETSALQLADILHSNASLEGKRSRFFSFFLAVAGFSNQSAMRSYYLQFSPFLLPLSQGLTGCSCDPAELCLWLKVADLFKSSAPENPDAIDAAEHAIRLTAILNALYAADEHLAARLLGISIPEETATQPSRLEAARRLAAQAPLPFGEELLTLLRNREGQDSAHELQVLLIDDSAIIDPGAEPAGRMLPLYAEAQERPSDADEDSALINNRAGFGRQAIYYTLQDGLLAARAHMPGSTAQRFYAVHYSLPDKSAEISGTSLGLAAALLAWVTSRNRHYRAEVVRLAASAAVTGGIRPDGTVTAVDSRTLSAKIRAAFFSPVERLFLPAANLAEAWPLLAALEQRYPRRRLLLQPLETLQQALQDRNLIADHKPAVPQRALAALRRSRHKILLTGVAAAAALGLLFATVPALQWWRDPQPALAEVSSDEIIFKNQAGKRLWSHQLGFTMPTSDRDNSRAVQLLIDDLDGDGRREVLFGLNEGSHPEQCGILFGYDYRGRALWPPIKLSRPLESLGGEQIADHFYFSPLLSFHIKPDQPKMILFSIGSMHTFASSLVLIDSKGSLRGSYWNSGHIPAITTHDVNRDGRMEIIAGLYGNEEGRARLAVFDPDDMQGASPQSKPEYTLRGLAPARHLRLYRFPASPFWEPGAYRDTVALIDLLGELVRVHLANNGMVKTATGSLGEFLMYRYTFSTSLEPIDFSDPPDRFLARFRDIFGREFSAADRARLEVIDEWDGKNWQPRRIGAENGQKNPPAPRQQPQLP